MKKSKEIKDLALTENPGSQPEIRLTRWDADLTPRQANFVAIFVDNELAGGGLTLQQIAEGAGYTKRNASLEASRLTSRKDFAALVASRKQFLASDEALRTTRADVLREWETIALGDTTQIAHVRRVCCRHCWGRQFGYQWRDAEFAEASAKAMNDADPLPDYTGGGGFDATRDPHPDCPECDGEGLEEVYVADIRKLRPEQKRLIKSVRHGKYGIEVEFRDQDKALENIANFLGLMVKKNEHAGPGGGPIPVAAAHVVLPSDPAEASRAYQLLMEGKRT